ncbi:MAG: hypothetical protein R3F48_08405 [Candidatus Zixiibacteriota bacterium]
MKRNILFVIIALMVFSSGIWGRTPSIELVGQYTDKPAYDLEVRGNYAYVTTLLECELYILDISDPESPNLIGSYTGSSLGVQDDQIREVALLDDYAYITRHWGGFEVIDISDPTMPIKVGTTYSAPGVTIDFVFCGDYGFLASREGGVHVYDVSNPENPVYITTYSTSAWASSVAINGNYLYVGLEHSPYGMDVFDISNPGIQNLVYTLPGSYSVYGVVANNTNAFLGLQYSGGLTIADVFNPAAISYVGSGFPTHGEPWGIAIAGNTLYLGERSYGLQILDVSDPSNPTLLAEYDTGGDPHWGIQVVGDYIYLVNGTNGLVVLKYSEQCQCMCGDTNGDGTVNVGDAVYLLNFIFKGGPSPDCNLE